MVKEFIDILKPSKIKSLIFINRENINERHQFFIDSQGVKELSEFSLKSVIKGVECRASVVVNRSLIDIVIV